MPKGFDWKTSFCAREGCGSKARTIGAKIAGSFAVECAGCRSLIGWLDPDKPMPVDMAKNVVCNYGARHHGRKLGDVPHEYIHWLYYHTEDMPKLLKFAVRALCTEGQ